MPVDSTVIFYKHTLMTARNKTTLSSLFFIHFTYIYLYQWWSSQKGFPNVATHGCPINAACDADKRFKSIIQSIQ